MSLVMIRNVFVTLEDLVHVVLESVWIDVHLSEKLVFIH